MADYRSLVPPPPADATVSNPLTPEGMAFLQAAVPPTPADNVQVGAPISLPGAEMFPVPTEAETQQVLAQAPQTLEEAYASAAPIQQSSQQSLIDTQKLIDEFMVKNSTIVNPDSPANATGIPITQWDAEMFPQETDQDIRNRHVLYNADGTVNLDAFKDPSTPHNSWDAFSEYLNLNQNFRNQFKQAGAVERKELTKAYVKGLLQQLGKPADDKTVDNITNNIVTNMSIAVPNMYEAPTRSLPTYLADTALDIASQTISGISGLVDLLTFGKANVAAGGAKANEWLAARKSATGQSIDKDINYLIENKGFGSASGYLLSHGGALGQFVTSNLASLFTTGGVLGGAAKAARFANIGGKLSKVGGAAAKATSFNTIAAGAADTITGSALGRGLVTAADKSFGRMARTFKYSPMVRTGALMEAGQSSQQLYEQAVAEGADTDRFGFQFGRAMNALFTGTVTTAFGAFTPTVEKVFGNWLVGVSSNAASEASSKASLRQLSNFINRVTGDGKISKAINKGLNTTIAKVAERTAGPAAKSAVSEFAEEASLGYFNDVYSQALTPDGDFDFSKVDYGKAAASGVKQGEFGAVLGGVTAGLAGVIPPRGKRNPNNPNTATLEEAEEAVRTAPNDDERAAATQLFNEAKTQYAYYEGLSGIRAQAQKAVETSMRNLKQGDAITGTTRDIAMKNLAYNQNIVNLVDSQLNPVLPDGVFRNAEEVSLAKGRLKEELKRLDSVYEELTKASDPTVSDESIKVREGLTQFFNTRRNEIQEAMKNLRVNARVVDSRIMNPDLATPLKKGDTDFVATMTAQLTPKAKVNKTRDLQAVRDGLYSLKDSLNNTALRNEAGDFRHQGAEFYNKLLGDKVEEIEKELTAATEDRKKKPSITEDFYYPFYPKKPVFGYKNSAKKLLTTKETAELKSKGLSNAEIKYIEANINDEFSEGAVAKVSRLLGKQLKIKANKRKGDTVADKFAFFTSRTNELNQIVDDFRSRKLFQNDSAQTIKIRSLAQRDPDTAIKAINKYKDQGKLSKDFDKLSFPEQRNKLFDLFQADLTEQLEPILAPETMEKLKFVSPDVITMGNTPVTAIQEGNIVVPLSLDTTPAQILSRLLYYGIHGDIEDGIHFAKDNEAAYERAAVILDSVYDRSPQVRAATKALENDPRYANFPKDKLIEKAIWNVREGVGEDRKKELPLSDALVIKQWQLFIDSEMQDLFGAKNQDAYAEAVRSDDGTTIPKINLEDDRRVRFEKFQRYIEENGDDFRNDDDYYQLKDLRNNAAVFGDQLSYTEYNNAMMRLNLAYARSDNPITAVDLETVINPNSTFKPDEEFSIKPIGDKIDTADYVIVDPSVNAAVTVVNRENKRYVTEYKGKSYKFNTINEIEEFLTNRGLIIKNNSENRDWGPLNKIQNLRDIIESNAFPTLTLTDASATTRETQNPIAWLYHYRDGTWRIQGKKADGTAIDETFSTSDQVIAKVLNTDEYGLRIIGKSTTDVDTTIVRWANKHRIPPNHTDLTAAATKGADWLLKTFGASEETRDLWSNKISAFMLRADHMLFDSKAYLNDIDARSNVKFYSLLKARINAAHNYLYTQGPGNNNFLSYERVVAEASKEFKKAYPDLPENTIERFFYASEESAFLKQELIKVIRAMDAEEGVIKPSAGELLDMNKYELRDLYFELSGENTLPFYDQTNADGVPNQRNALSGFTHEGKSDLGAFEYDKYFTNQLTEEQQDALSHIKDLYWEAAKKVNEVQFYYGVISAATLQSRTDRGFWLTTSDEGRVTSKGKEGRTTEVTDIVSNSLRKLHREAYNAIVRDANDLMLQTLILEHPDKAAWETVRITETSRNELKDWDTGVENGKTVVTVNYNGQWGKLTVSDPKLARFFKDMDATRRLNEDKVNKAVMMWTGMMSNLSMLRTTINPKSLVKFLARDMLRLVTGLQGAQDFKAVNLTWGDRLGTLANVARYLVNGYTRRSNEDPFAVAYAALAGETHYEGRAINEDILREMQSPTSKDTGIRGRLNDLSRKAQRIPEIFGANILENAPRYAAFTTITKKLMGKDKISSKDIVAFYNANPELLANTVNATKRITIDYSQMGAGWIITGGGGSARVRPNMIWNFFSSSATGTQNFLRSLTNPDDVKMIGAALTIMGALYAIRYSSLTDDEKEQDKAKKDSILLPGGWQFPLEYEFRPFMEIIKGIIRMSDNKASLWDVLSGGIIEALNDSFPINDVFNPDLKNNLVYGLPTIAQPLMQLSINSNQWGKPITPAVGSKNAAGETVYKKSQMWDKNTPPWAKRLGKNIEEIFGGTPIAPATMAFLVKSYAGFPGRDLADGLDFNKRYNPAKLFFDNDPSINFLYGTKEDFNTKKAMYAHLQETGKGSPAAMRIIAETEARAKPFIGNSAFNKATRKLKAQRDMLKARGGYDEQVENLTAIIQQRDEKALRVYQDGTRKLQALELQ